MRGHLHSLTRWLRLVLACLAVGSAVSPAQVASAADPVGVVQGGAGKKPVAIARLRQFVREVGAPLVRKSRTGLKGLLRAAAPCFSGPALYLRHRALLR